MATPYLAQIDVKLAANFEKYDQAKANGKLHVYNTTSKNRGVVKTINIYKINHDDSQEDCRKGSEIDVRNLVSLFEQMGFTIDMDEKTKTQSPYTKQDIIDNLTEFVNNEKLKTADSAILFIMGHGGRNSHKRDYLYLANDEKIYYDEVYEYFNNAKCSYMQNKPKMIFSQMCRGDEPDSGVSLIQTDGAPSSGPVIPSFCMYFQFTNSWALGFSAVRLTNAGSLFIIKLFEEFMKEAHEEDVVTMLAAVNQKISEEKFYIASNAIVQAAEHTNRTFRKCYLNPGIYRDDDGVVRYIKTDEEVSVQQVNVNQKADKPNINPNNGKMRTDSRDSEQAPSRKVLQPEAEIRRGEGGDSGGGRGGSGGGSGGSGGGDGASRNGGGDGGSTYYTVND